MKRYKVDWEPRYAGSVLCLRETVTELSKACGVTPEVILLHTAKPDLVLAIDHDNVMHRVRTVIELEPELTDVMPTEMFEAVKNDKDAMQELYRIVVRKTKEGILQKLNDEMLLPIERRKS